MQCPLVLVISYMSFQRTKTYRWEEDMGVELDTSDYEGVAPMQNFILRKLHFLQICRLLLGIC